MYAAAAIGIIVTMTFALLRALLGPTTFDRILAANMVGTKTTLLIAVLGFLTDRPEFLDIALIYALMNFIAVIAVMRYTQYGEFVSSRGGTK